MKQWLGRFLLSPEFQNSIWARPARALVRKTSPVFRYSAQFVSQFQATDRPHYAYCLLNAADLARRLGLSKISAIEFGVAGGNGLSYLCEFGREVERATGVAIDCYGFDSGEGMPRPTGVRDLPYWFKEHQYAMDVAKLRSRLPEAKLVLGQISDTISEFVAKHRPAPIGAIFNDTDYWSSTLDSFRLFDSVARDPGCFLPRIFMYFDDIIGSSLEMYGEFNGQLGAIKEFNDQNESIKIHLNQNLLQNSHQHWRFQIYYAHLFDHPQYAQYIGNDQQLHLEQELALR